MNPLLDFAGLPRFAEIKPEHVAPAIEQLLAENRALIVRLLSDSAPPTWQNFVVPMEDANERLSRAWGPVGHLNAVMNSPELREVYNATLPKITQYYAELGQNLALFEKFKALRNSPEFAGLSAARKKIIENELRDFRLGGAELPDDKKARYLEIQERLSELSSRFSDNLLDATNDYTLVIENKDELDGLPDDVLQAAQEAAQAADKNGWLFTLKAPSYMPVMQYADNRALREKMYRAYGTRASEFGKPEWDNTTLMDEIVKLRGEEARLLGFANFGELSLGEQDGELAAASGRVHARAGEACAAFCRKGPGRTARIRAQRTGHRRAAILGCGLCQRKAARTALCLLRTGSETVFPGRCSAARHVQTGRDAVRLADQAGQRAGLA